jgi:FkbM family methyltransferase
MRSRIGNAFRRFGLELVPSWRLPRLPFATHLRKLLDQLRITCVLDVGANTGQFGMFLRREVGYTGPIISFEPVAEVCVRLRAQAQRDRDWHVFQLALGRESGSVPVHVMAASDLSSLHAPKRGGTQYRHNVIVRDETVELRTLDSLANELATLAPLDRVYLKCDTQGHDLDVIEGAAGLLERIAALQTEMAVIPVYEGVPRYLEALATLEEQGYAVSAMFPVASDGDLHLIEFDCVMVRHARLAEGS